MRLPILESIPQSPIRRHSSGVIHDSVRRWLLREDDALLPRTFAVHFPTFQRFNGASRFLLILPIPEEVVFTVANRTQFPPPPKPKGKYTREPTYQHIVTDQGNRTGRNSLKAVNLIFQVISSPQWCNIQSWPLFPSSRPRDVKPV